MGRHPLLERPGLALGALDRDDGLHPALRHPRAARDAAQPVSVKCLVAVAEARASFADHRTGRNCRPTNARLAAMTGLSVRTVQRASTALRLLGVATEVMRGRQRSRAERFASWRVGDKGRGWASVWALHDCRIQSLSPHPGGSHLAFKTSRKSVLTTHNRRQTAGSSAAARRPSPEPRALALANKWIADQQSPPWARRYRTGTPWTRILAGAGPTRVDTARRQHPHPRLGRHRTLVARGSAQADRAARRDAGGARRPEQPTVGLRGGARARRARAGTAPASPPSSPPATTIARHAKPAAPRCRGPGIRRREKRCATSGERARRRRYDSPDADGAR